MTVFAFSGVELLSGELTAWPFGTRGISPLLLSSWWLETGGLSLMKVSVGQKQKKYCVLAEL